MACQCCTCPIPHLQDQMLTDVDVALAVAPASAAMLIDELTNLTISVTNQGDTSVADVSVAVQLPVELVLSTGATPSGESCCSIPVQC